MYDMLFDSDEEFRNLHTDFITATLEGDGPLISTAYSMAMILYLNNNGSNSSTFKRMHKDKIVDIMLDVDAFRHIADLDVIDKGFMYSPLANIYDLERKSKGFIKKVAKENGWSIEESLEIVNNSLNP